MQQHNEKLARITGNVVIVGIDVAKRTHWARITETRGFSLTPPFSFQNTRDGFFRLRAKMERAREQTQAKSVVLGLEPTGHYWKPLAWHLKEAGYTLVLVNPYHVKRRKELEDNSPTKSDRDDAGLIASLVRQGKYMTCLLPECIYADLRNLHVTRENQRRQVNRAQNQLQA